MPREKREEGRGKREEEKLVNDESNSFQRVLQASLFPSPSSLFPPSADPSRLRRPIRAVVPILRAGVVRHSPVVAVPAVESVHVKCPESGVLIAQHDETVS